MQVCRRCKQEKAVGEFQSSKSPRVYDHCYQCRHEKRVIRYNKRKARGICCDCASRPVIPSFVRCLVCTDKANKKREEKRSKCNWCKTCPARPNYSTCESCKDKSSTTNRVKSAARAVTGICKDCGLHPSATETPGGRCENCLEKARVIRRNQRQDLIDRYGGKCNCCGEANPYFLQIDHVNNDGGKHRLQAGGNNQVLSQIYKEPYNPDKYQLLCSNCNFSKDLYGTCPHTWAEVISLRDLRPALRQHTASRFRRRRVA